MKSYNFYRTDLVDESEEMVRHRTDSEKDTLKTEEGIHFEESRIGRIRLTEVTVNEEGEKKIGKSKGKYITISLPTLTPEDNDGMNEMTSILLEKLNKMLTTVPNVSKRKILFIGLGNRDITPDAVGPLTMDILRNIVPDYYSEGDSEVFVYAPGVTIQTGLETADFVKAMVSEIKPDLLIVIDALAARDSSRLCKTIQLTNTGIHPGSGVGNSRKEVSHKTVGIPVFAIGIPTVVDGPVLIADAINTMFGYIASKISEKDNPSSRLAVTPWLRSEDKDADRSKLEPIFGDWASWPHEDRIQLFEEVLTTQELNTFISPKEIDSWVSMYADTLASSLTEWINEMKNNEHKM
ncbi:GPR endopeptidase [Sporosarcina siberiensis]|uniref:Germination protease n=1 Tax=Sporosarcina siberiensis TaxID=1365606 RepID=A0ABW4SFQ6_9BACL